MSESMVERVAKALREHDRLLSRGGWTEWEKARPERRQKYISRARAMMEAMCGPPESICVAGVEATGIRWGFGHTDAEICWNAMLESALSSGAEKP